VELLAVSAILLMMAGTLGSLAMSVQNTSQYQFSRGVALQHGQVTLVRLRRTIEAATANNSFPGFAVFAERVGADTFPETLVVWRPAAAAVDPNGMPRINELIVYTPNPSALNELLEITKPLDLRVAPSLADANAWQQELNSFRTSSDAQRVVVTDLLRVAAVRNGAGPVTARAALRFEAVRRPSATQWGAFLGGTVAWESLPWVQGIYSQNVGLCQSRCRIELQLRPGDTTDNHRDLAIPFFGSAAVYFSLTKP
jgi:hypothetical protein